MSNKPVVALLVVIVVLLAAILILLASQIIQGNQQASASSTAASTMGLMATVRECGRKNPERRINGTLTFDMDGIRECLKANGIDPNRRTGE